MQAINPVLEAADTSSVARILGAAEALFSEMGFDAVSMNAIAERAGVSKANIFHHFSNKHALYLAVVKEACKESQTRLLQLEEGEGSFVERLGRFARSQLQAMLQNSQTTRLILRDLLENGETHGEELARQVFGPNFARLVELIRDGQTRDELRRDMDPAAVAIMLIATNVYFFEARDVLRHYPYVDFADDAPRFSDKMMQVLLHALVPPGK